MRYQHSLRPLENRLGRLALAIALGFVAVFGLIAFGQSPVARAASQGDVFVYPLAGGPGTHVYLQLNFFGDPQLYQVKVATKSTEEGGCDSAQTLSGDGGKPIQLGGQDATTARLRLAEEPYLKRVLFLCLPDVDAYRWTHRDGDATRRRHQSAARSQPRRPSRRRSSRR